MAYDSRQKTVRRTLGTAGQHTLHQTQGGRVHGAPTTLTACLQKTLGLTEAGGVSLAETVAQLVSSLDALGALAAHLRVEAEGLEVDPAVEESLTGIVGALVGDTSEMPDAQREAIIAMARTSVYQAWELIEHPDQAPGWKAVDERLLQSIGKVEFSSLCLCPRGGATMEAGILNRDQTPLGLHNADSEELWRPDEDDGRKWNQAVHPEPADSPSME